MEEKKSLLSRIVGFCVSPKLYDFSVPSPAPNLSKLREPLSLDIEQAERLHIPSLHVEPTEEPIGEVDSPSGPDWELARRLFVPDIRRQRWI